MSSFYERQKSLFNQLKDAEDQCSFSKTNKASKDQQDYGTIDKQTYRRLKNEMKQFRGKESIFKRSEAKISDCLKAKRIPDHVRNPQKYSYYSLADVTPDQMSDATNLATARAWIQEMEERQVKEVQMEGNDDNSVFKKPTFRISSTVKVRDNNTDKPVFKNGKLVMPEYVVGVKKTQIKNKPLGKTSQDDQKKAVALKLNHLYDDDEDD